MASAMRVVTAVEKKRLLLPTLTEMTGPEIAVDKFGSRAFSASGANTNRGIRAE